MRLATRRETIRGLFTIVLLVGALQFIHIYPQRVVTARPLAFSRIHTTTTRAVQRKVVKTIKPNVTSILIHKRLSVSNGGTHTKRTNETVAHIAQELAGRPNETVAHIAQELAGTGSRIPPLKINPQLFLPPNHEPLTSGRLRKTRGFLTIGIPSVRRPTADTIYLIQTLQSLLHNTDSAEQRDVTVVVLLSDFNQTYNDALCEVLVSKFHRSLDDGFIRIIKPPLGIYPNFDQIKRTYNDGRERLKWRAKQNIDFAYLFMYSSNISQYYIQLEDDILSASNFTSLIRLQIEQQNKILTHPWFMLEFSKLGFIGKLFRSADLTWVADFLLNNFDLKPGDLQLGLMLKQRGQPKPIHIKQSLFQHNGKFSSLQNKLMPSIDASFRDAEAITLPIMRLPKGDNPDAKLFTNFDTVNGYPLTNAYDGNSTTFYWAKRVRRNQYFQLVLQKAQNFSRIIVSTGDEKRKQDSLSQSILYISSLQRGISESNACGSFKKIADFIDGEIDTKAMGIKAPLNTKCIKIMIRKDSKTWVKIRDIVLLH